MKKLLLWVWLEIYSNLVWIKKDSVLVIRLAFKSRYRHKLAMHKTASR